jgi:hypothetical protein
VAQAKVDAKFAPKSLDLEKNLAQKQHQQAAVVRADQTEVPAMRRSAEAIQNNIAQSAYELEVYERTLGRAALGGLMLLLLVGGITCVVFGLMRMSSGRSRGTPFLASGLSMLILLFMVGLMGTFYLMTTRGNQMDEQMAFRGGAKMRGPQAAAPVPLVGQDNAPMADEKRMERLNEAVPGDLNALPDALEPLKKNLEGLVRDELERKKKEIGDKFAADGLMPPELAPINPLAEAKVAMARPPVWEKPMGGPGRDARIMAGIMREQQLRRQVALAVARMEPFVVREYAHVRQPLTDGVRRDFTETLYWHPVLVLPDGIGEISFDLSHATTQFQVLAAGHTLDGQLGSTTIDFASRLPYSLQPKAPVEVNSNDKIIIPVTVANDTERDQSVRIEAQGKGLKIADGPFELTAPAGQRKRQLVSVEPALIDGDAFLNLTGRFGPLGSDRIEPRFKIVPEGFPVVGSHSDLLENQEARYQFTLPEKWIKGTLQCQVQVFPSTLADLQKGLEAMLREPCGCFEQSSSSNYPNVLIINYLKDTEQNLPDVEKKARQLLASGYEKLTSFECVDPQAQAKRKGYEWFGQTAPPHEALTAYGLLQFKDMAKIHAVDKAMVERTRKYLLGQRDQKGGFKRNARALDTFGRAPDDITNAYIVWALTEAGGDDDLETELTALITLAKDSKDPYFLALVGNSLINRNKTQEGQAILKKLVELQKEDGRLEGTRTSITGSTGRYLQIETTALAILAWLKANRPEFQQPVNKATGWIGKQRGGHGDFGATQSTILALKALIAHARSNRRPSEAGELRLFLNDEPKPVSVLAFAAGSQEPLVLRVPREDLLKPGKNKVKVVITGKNAFPYTLTWSYRTLKPANPETCPVHLTTSLDQPVANEGDTVRLKVQVQNKSGQGQGMAVAILGLPAGLEVPPDFTQLKDLARLQDNGTKRGRISFFELRGRELVLYWRELAPNQKIDLAIDLICQYPGQYRGPASRAYLYYNADQKFWVEPVAVNIQPKAD